METSALRWFLLAATKISHTAICRVQRKEGRILQIWYACGEVKVLLEGNVV